MLLISGTVDSGGVVGVLRNQMLSGGGGELISRPPAKGREIARNARTCAVHVRKAGRDVALMLPGLVDVYRGRQYGAECEGERDET